MIPTFVNCNIYKYLYKKENSCTNRKSDEYMDKQLSRYTEK